MLSITLQVDLYSVTYAWQYCVDDTFWYHKKLLNGGVDGRKGKGRVSLSSNTKCNFKQ